MEIAAEEGNQGRLSPRSRQQGNADPLFLAGSLPAPATAINKRTAFPYAPLPPAHVAPKRNSGRLIHAGDPAVDEAFRVFLKQETTRLNFRRAVF
jgi:hypothetical protein